MKNLTASQTSTLYTTTNAIGSFAGNQIPNLQMDRLDPGEYTLQFELVQPTIDLLGSSTYAFISWKVGGQSLQRIISVYSGAAISGVCEAVHVKLLDQSGRSSANLLPYQFNMVNGSPNFTTTGPISLVNGESLSFPFAQPGVFYTNTAPVKGTSGSLTTPYTGPSGFQGALAFSPYQIGVTLSKGTRPTTMQPPTLTSQSGVQVGSLSIQDINIPQDAGILSVMVGVAVISADSQAETANSYIQFRDVTGTLIGGYQPINFPGWFPIPPGAKTLRLLNRSAVPTATMLFTVQWGIEG